MWNIAEDDPLHPRHALWDAQTPAAQTLLPVVDHYSGTPALMQKSLALQAELIAQHRACLVDITLDCEDGAAVGEEAVQVQRIITLINEAPMHIAGVARRIGVRVHAVGHPCFNSDVQELVRAVGEKLAYLMLPKVETLSQVERLVGIVDALGARELPIHVLIESELALHHAHNIAAHPRVESLSFGLMDFVSSHRGAIPAHAMSVEGQFSHPLVQRAKLEIAAAAHAHGKTPSHCVVTEFRDLGALRTAAQTAAHSLGYTRMWSIHPAQIPVILAAFAPASAELECASDILRAAHAANWGPINYHGVLHDRASYRYYWQILERGLAMGTV